MVINMRRKDREITDRSAMLGILSACDCCRLGLLDERGAYILPLNFGYEEADGKLILYFHSASEGKKIDLIKAQKTASFEMDRKHSLVESEIACGYSFLYQSVMGNGTVELLDDYDEKVHALGVIMSHYSHRQDFCFDKEQVGMVAVIRLTVTDWSCKEY